MVSTVNKKLHVNKENRNINMKLELFFADTKLYIVKRT